MSTKGRLLYRSCVDPLIILRTGATDLRRVMPAEQGTAVTTGVQPCSVEGFHCQFRGNLFVICNGSWNAVSECQGTY